jgi:hypothetical protein
MVENIFLKIYIDGNKDYLDVVLHLMNNKLSFILLFILTSENRN